MDANDFVAELAKLAPTREALLAAGRSPEGFEKNWQSFVCKPRLSPLDMETYGDAMLELVRDWDVSTVEIGMFSFHDVPVRSCGLIHIGKIEAEELVLREETRDYVVLEHEVPGRVCCLGAGDGGSLLAALLLIAGYFVKTGLGEVDIDDEDAADAVKRECVQVLGGEEYDGIPTLLLGV